ncbi:unnamed protein product [Ixodes persulcatus]
MGSTSPSSAPIPPGAFARTIKAPSASLCSLSVMRGIGFSTWNWATMGMRATVVFFQDAPSENSCS